MNDLVDLMAENEDVTIGKPVFFCNEKTAKFLMQQSHWFNHLRSQQRPPLPGKYRGPRLRSIAQSPSKIKAMYHFATTAARGLAAGITSPSRPWLPFTPARPAQVFTVTVTA